MSTTQPDYGAAENALQNYAFDYDAPGIRVHADYSQGVDPKTAEELAEAGFQFHSVEVRGTEVDVMFEKVA